MGESDERRESFYSVRGGGGCLGMCQGGTKQIFRYFGSFERVRGEGEEVK